MKRLNLKAFEAQKPVQDQKEQINQLLGQVLGDCHDQVSPSKNFPKNPHHR